ncbi:uncharacterized protein BDV17DRAFT_166674 [Aspergillus undulatus]|uniref:uncharacterized protein n=1 Tax=Aspergillus undulatus TaxID=1810928 RepID=UPI003CCC9EDF
MGLLLLQLSTLVCHSRYVKFNNGSSHARFLSGAWILASKKMSRFLTSTACSPTAAQQNTSSSTTDIRPYVGRIGRHTGCQGNWGITFIRGRSGKHLLSHAVVRAIKPSNFRIYIGHGRMSSILGWQVAGPSTAARTMRKPLPLPLPFSSDKNRISISIYMYPFI